MIDKYYHQYLKILSAESFENNSPYYSREFYPKVDDIWDFLWLTTIDSDFAGRFFHDYPNLKQDNSHLQQESLLFVIVSFFEKVDLDKIRKTGKGQIWYLLANAIASYCSYNRYYWLSMDAKRILMMNSFNLNFAHSRNSIFQLRKDGKKLLTFEHMCPATELIDILCQKVKSLEANHNKWSRNNYLESLSICISETIREYSLVCIISKSDNDNLNKEYRSKLPESDDSPLVRMLSRYNYAEIELEQSLVQVYGKMYR